jgi:hypothetical protein
MTLRLQILQSHLYNKEEFEEASFDLNVSQRPHEEKTAQENGAHSS